MPEIIDRFILVRHAMPVLQPDVPAVSWELDEQGRAASRACADLLPAAAYCVSSSEPKALQTLQEMAAANEVLAEDGFREVHQPDGWSDNYHDLVRAYLAGTQHAGWETQDEVTARLEDAFQRHAEEAAARQKELVIGCHGLSATIWLASRLTLEPTPTDFWAGLALPDVIQVDLAAKQVTKLKS